MVMVKRIIAGATGFVGEALTRDWLSRGIHVIALGRSKEKINALFGHAVEGVSWSQIKNDSNRFLNGASAVVNLSGAGIADALWTKKRKQEILQSRVEATQCLSSLCAQASQKPPALLNASAIGIYGFGIRQANDSLAVYDEYSDIEHEGVSFLADVCRQWEKATYPASREGVRVVNMRLGHVLGAHGGLFGKMRAPFSLGLGAVFGSGKQIMSWISLRDLCAVIEFLIDAKDISGPVNCVSPAHVSNRKFSKALAGALKKPCFIRVPAWLLKAAVGSMAEELFLSGQYVQSAKLAEKGFVFKDSDIFKTFENIS